MSARPPAELPPHPAPSAAPPAHSQPPASFGQIARRIRGFAANLVATGVILVLALAGGRQLVEWWRVDPAAPQSVSSPVATAGVDPWEAYSIEFGDSAYRLQQRTVKADRSSVGPLLLAECRRAAAETALPDTPPDAAELKLLEAVRALEPLETTPEGVRLYGPPVGFPLIVAVAPAGSSSRSAAQPADPQAGSQPSQPAALGASRDRVITWNLAAPAGQEVWSLYTFRLGPAAAGAAGGPPPVALPPGSRRTLLVRDPQGETLLAFAGTGAAAAWRQFFATELAAQGWSTDEAWRLSGEVWQARFVRQAEAGATTAEIQLGPDEAGGLTGLARIVPPPAPVTEKK